MVFFNCCCHHLQPPFYIFEHLSNPQTRAGPPPLLLLPSVTFFTLLPCHPPLLLLYCTVLNEMEESASMILSLETIPWSIHIIKAPNLSWSSFPPLLSFPPSCFLHCCCRQLLYHQFSCNSCGLCQDMEH